MFQKLIVSILTWDISSNINALVKLFLHVELYHFEIFISIISVYYL
jgi:hypothetical protein